MSIFWFIYFTTAAILFVAFSFMIWQDIHDKQRVTLKDILVGILVVITPVLNVYVMCSGVIELYQQAMKRYRKRTK